MLIGLRCVCAGVFSCRRALAHWHISTLTVTEKHPGRVKKRLQTFLKADYVEASSATIQEAVRQLDEYFREERRTFDVPLLFVGTDFQKQVWRQLLEIPYGHTVSYGEMARQLGKPSAVRAVANANGANAISIFAPCHRVIGSNHSLTGYGGGLEAKRFLLRLEGLSF